MPSAPRGIHTLLFALTMACSTVALGADGTPSSAGTGSNTAASAPAEGVVQRALQPLYTMPKGTDGRVVAAPSAAPAAGGSPSYVTRKPYTPPKTVPLFSRNLAAPSHSAASAAARQPAASPDENDLRSAGLDEAPASPRDADRAYVPPSVGGYRGFGPYGYGRLGFYDYRRTLRWPSYSREWNDPEHGAGHENMNTYGDTSGPGGFGYGGAGPYGYGYGAGPYGYGYGGGANIPPNAPYSGATAGWSGDYQYFDYMSNARTASLLAGALTAKERGLKAFRQGQYREAADAFRLACDNNNGDPAAQLYAGHALFASGRYHEAVQYIRKAFELQSRIMYLTYDMRDDYGDRAQFDRQVAALQEALRLSPQDPDRLFMLGYVLYYGGQREKAYGPLSRLARLAPGDSLAAKLADSCRPPDVAITAPPPAPHRP